MPICARLHSFGQGFLSWGLDVPPPTLTLETDSEHGTMLTTSDQNASATATIEPPLTGTMPLDKERRDTSRLPSNVPIKLSTLGWSECRTCTTDDLSEGGLYLRLPAAYALKVGQRCEVGFENEGNAAELSSVAGEIRYATVVRTDAAGELIGAGLRFDQPLFL